VSPLLSIRLTAPLRFPAPLPLPLPPQGVWCSLRQVLDCGFFHADPHPGNLAVTPGGQLVYFDFGMMSHLQEEARYGLIARGTPLRSHLLGQSRANQAEQSRGSCTGNGFVCPERERCSLVLSQLCLLLPSLAPALRCLSCTLTAGMCLAPWLLVLRCAACTVHRLLIFVFFVEPLLLVGCSWCTT